MYYEGQSNENRTLATKWQCNLFYSKVISRSINTFIPLGDEMINSSLVERGSRWWIHNLPHSCTSSSKWNCCPLVSFFRSLKMWSHKGKDLACTEDVEVFPSHISEAYHSPDWQYGDSCYHTIGWFCPTTFQGVLTLWHIAVSATCMHSTLHWLWFHALESRQAEGPCSQRKKSSWF